MFHSKEILQGWIEDTLDGIGLEATEDQVRYLTDEIYTVMQDDYEDTDDLEDT